MTFRPSRALVFLAVLCSCVLTLTGSSPTRPKERPKDTRINAAVAPRIKRLRPPRAAHAAQEEHYATYELSGAFYDVRGRWSSRLTLNNKGAEAMQPVVTLFSHNGRAFRVPQITVAATSFLDVDLQQMARQAGGEFEYGSLRVTYEGHELEMGAQVLISDLDRSLQFDEQLSYATGAKSNRRETIWWLPDERATLSMVLTNLTDQVATVRGTLRGGQGGSGGSASVRLDDVRLGPHELRVVDLRGGVQRLSGEVFGGISIEFDGPAGGVLARGFVEDARSGYSAPLLFADPAGAKTSSYHGAGFRLDPVGSSRMRPVILARNVGTAPATVSGQIVLSTVDGHMATFVLPTTPLNPGQTTPIGLGQAWDEAVGTAGRLGVGLEFEYSGAPGTVIMSATTVSADSTHVLRVPLIDPETVPSSTGGYMWRADGTTITTVYLKNMTTAPQKYLLQLSFAGGAYAPGLKTLQPGETVAIDLRVLRDTQVPDAFGRTIPREITGGQVHWSAKGRNRYAMIGRAEHVDLAHGVSASYACINCCPDNPYSSWTVNTPIIAAIGEPTDVALTMQDIDCYETVLEPYTLGGLEWNIGNTGIATGDSNSSTVTGISEGSTTLYATYNTEWWYKETYDGGWYCEDESYPVYFETTVQSSCAYPVNLAQNTAQSFNAYPMIQFTYVFASSTGNTAHLAQCEIGERLEGDAYPSPPWAANLPVTGDFHMTWGNVGQLSDAHWPQGYNGSPSASTVELFQSYWYKCPCKSDNALFYLGTPWIIQRSIALDNGQWRYAVLKNGTSASKIIP